jgi:hypothetical protein
MPKEKSNSLVSSTKKLKKKQQKNDDLATLNIEILDDNMKNEKNTKKKTTLKKSHNKSLSAPNFTKLEQLNKLQTNLNETFATTDLQNTDSSASLVNQDFSSLILINNNNNNNNSKQFPPISELTSPSLRSTSRSNDRFRQLFPSVPLSETVIDSKLNINYIFLK